MNRNRISMTNQHHLVVRLANHRRDLRECRQRLPAHLILSGWEENRLRQADNQTARLHSQIQTLLLELSLRFQKTRASGNDCWRRRRGGGATRAFMPCAATATNRISKIVTMSV